MTTTARSAVDAVDKPSRDRRRVLWVMKGLGRGGAERLTVDCARAFDATRWTVDVAYVLPHKDALAGELCTAGIDVCCLGEPDSRIGWVRTLARLLRGGEYDLVHTHSPLPGIAVRALPRGARPPVVHTEHNMWARYHPLTRWANAVTFGRNEAALAVSDGVARSARPPFGGPRPAVLHHGIDVAGARHGPQARRMARGMLDLAMDAPVIGTVANFTPKKDHATLLAAVAAVIDRHPGLRVVLVGSGPLEDELRDRVRTLGLQREVVFTGSRGDVRQILPAFDLFVLSSRYEGLPIALLEAMASGVTPVATAVGGVPEVITDGADGRLVATGDPDALASTLGDLLDAAEPRAALAARARRRAADFDIARAVRRIEHWYEEILS